MKNRKKKIYLAGPDVFRKDAKNHMEKLISICDKYGFEGLSPLDNEINVSNHDLNEALTIFRSNTELIDECDIVVANIQPFRGACIDDGTAFEIGYGFARGKLICGYSELYEMKLSEIVEKFSPENHLSDDFPGIENFGLSHNLMIAGAISDSHGIIAKSFEDVLKHFNKNNQ